MLLASPTQADVDAVRRVSPLAAHLFLQCGPFKVPIGVFASAPPLETEQSEAADAPRKFLADDPRAGGCGSGATPTPSWSANDEVCSDLVP